jgi:hypothetical protein
MPVITRVLHESCTVDPRHPSTPAPALPGIYSAIVQIRFLVLDPLP